MKIELKRKAEDFSQKLNLEESPEALELEAEGATFEKQIRVELWVNQSQDQVICRGKARTSVKLECSRCLTEYDQKISSDLDFVIDLRENLSSGSIGDGMKSEEEGYFVADSSATFFEIDDLVRDALILSLPLKPLCSEDCKGLCPICGTDLNRSQCDCVKEKTDPRWDQLKGLLKKKS
jgi:uncharacterized protein